MFNPLRGSLRSKIILQSKSKEADINYDISRSKKPRTNFANENIYNFIFVSGAYLLSRGAGQKGRAIHSTRRARSSTAKLERGENKKVRCPYFLPFGAFPTINPLGFFKSPGGFCFGKFYKQLKKISLCYIGNMENPNFLKQKYNLHNASEVKRAVRRAEERTGEKVPQDPETRIQIYLDRLKNVINPPKLDGHENFDRRERNLRLLKNMLHEREVIKPEEVPESYFESIRQRHRDEGYGEIEISENLHKEIIEPIIEDQKNSLDIWVDYLTSKDAKYPDYFKYWVFRSILKMGRYDKEKKKFTERYSGTVSPFPELNREALSLVANAMEKKVDNDALAENKRKKLNEIIDFGYDIQEDTRQRFLKELERKNFAKLYGIAIEEFRPISEELLKVTNGQWRKFPKGTDPDIFVDTLKNYGTGWCIRGKSTAKRYLDTNDLEVFYSNDEEGNPAVPRVVIVSNGDHISEVRGVEKQENLDSYIGDVVQKKLETMPGGKSFEKKAGDMRKLTEIFKKHKENQPLTKDDLVFLYEIEQPIEGFGYQRDPRIEEIRKTRNPKVDAPIVFECSPEEIAWKKEDISENTQTYVGPLFKGIFQKNIENIFTSFPETRIEQVKLKIGGVTGEDLKQKIRNKKDEEGRSYQISSYAEDMMSHENFVVLKNTEVIDLVRLKVKDLGFTEDPTTDELFARAAELGLKLCPPEVGPHLRLKYDQVFKRPQPLYEWLRIGMKQIPDRDGYLAVFSLDRYDGGLWLRVYWAEPGYRRGLLDGEFVFRLRKDT